MLDTVPALPNFNQPQITATRSYLVQFGETAGYSLAEFDEALNPDSERPVEEIEEMIQAIWDAI